MKINRREYFCFKCGKTREYAKVDGGFKCKTCGIVRTVRKELE